MLGRRVNWKPCSSTSTAAKIPLWNVHGVSVRTNNHLEGWHNRMNKRARKHHLPGVLSLYTTDH
ncbi:hypothetical protein T10_9218 [Trichinella papuae]|uniref:Uncharacterized protein n=1 Tax=Trichinella papuae TaxID=268474 RepID=A0A0V1MEN2_9BILA|nr:hypothetical protein T10_9218 [Trichinella papuae]